jgi:SAM-dependent methyltransferase
MDFFRQTLGGIVGGSVLDVATDEGGFVRILVNSLKSYAEIVGLDISHQAIDTATHTINQRNIRFMQMDAEELDFADEGFDTVSISASLHHLSNTAPVLLEMKRVLKPGGVFIIAEAHSDGETAAQLTSVYLHQWVAAVDSALGKVHNSTLTRQEVMSRAESLGLVRLTFHDASDTESDPMDHGRIERLEGLISRNIRRAEEASSPKMLLRRGAELQQRLRNVGAQREPVLVVLGEKRKKSPVA